jgi:hypothetical protein
MNVIGGTSDEIVKALTPGDDLSSSDKIDLANEINKMHFCPQTFGSRHFANITRT